MLDSVEARLMDGHHCDNKKALLSWLTSHSKRMTKRCRDTTDGVACSQQSLAELISSPDPVAQGWTGMAGSGTMASPSADRKS